MTLSKEIKKIEILGALFNLLITSLANLAKLALLFSRQVEGFFSYYLHPYQYIFHALTILYSTLVCRIDVHAHLLNWRKSSPLHGLILVCMFFFNFEKKFPPARPYLGLHVYCFLEKNPPCTSIPSCTFIGILSFLIKSNGCIMVA